MNEQMNEHANYQCTSGDIVDIRVLLHRPSTDTCKARLRVTSDCSLFTATINHDIQLIARYRLNVNTFYRCNN